MAQFTGNREMTFYSLHSAPFRAFYEQTGPTPPGTMSVPIKGKLMDTAGTVTDVAGTLAVTKWIKVTATPDPDQYPPSDTWYPNCWKFHFGDDVPADLRHFEMVPIVETGQAGFFAFGGQYCEGAVYLRDAQGKDIGRGFAESVLYADPRRLMIRLAGLPDTPDTLARVTPQAPSLLQKLSTLAYLAWPPNRRELAALMARCASGGTDLGGG